MAGGGFRFGYYLGIYAAMQARGQPPDLLLASCGGALAAALIQALPDNDSRLEYLCAEPMYQYWRNLPAGPGSRLTSLFRQLAKRRLSPQHCKKVPDLFTQYLFELPPKIPVPVRSFYEGQPAIALIGAELLFQPEQAGQARHNQALFRQIVMGPDALSPAIKRVAAPLSQYEPHSTVLPDIHCRSDLPLEVALRIAISDMYYFQPAEFAGNYYIGGAIDLLPLEIGQALASEVIAERKPRFDRWLASPALISVFGVEPNQRLMDVMRQSADTWIDTRDMRQMLPEPLLQKRLEWWHNQLRLRGATSHAEHRQRMHQQWQYGYQRGMAAQ